MNCYKEFKNTLIEETPHNWRIWKRSWNLSRQQTNIELKALLKFVKDISDDRINLFIKDALKKIEEGNYDQS